MLPNHMHVSKSYILKKKSHQYSTNVTDLQHLDKIYFVGGRSSFMYHG